MTESHGMPGALVHFLKLAKQLVQDAEDAGVIITVERVPYAPLAMRNHIAHVEVREKR